MTDANEVGNYVTDDTFSLAALANLDTSDVAVLSSRLPMAGLWTVLCTAAVLSVSKVSEAEAAEGKTPLPKIQYKFESVKIDPADKPEDFDPSKTVGRKLTDTTVLWPKDFEQEVGILKGKYKRVNLPTEGKLGGIEGTEGWIDGAVGQIIVLRVRHFESKGEQRAGIDWVGLPDDDSTEDQAA